MLLQNFLLRSFQVLFIKYNIKFLIWEDFLIQKVTEWKVVEQKKILLIEKHYKQFLKYKDEKVLYIQSCIIYTYYF